MQSNAEGDGPAGVGFHKGNGVDSFVASGITDFLTLHTDVWNVGCPGLRAFRVDTDPPTELTPNLPAPDPATFSFTVTADIADSSKLVVSFTSVPPLTPDQILVEAEYELTNRDQCEVIAAPVKISTADEITGLDSYSDYTVYLTPYNQCGAAMPASSYSATTGEDEPGLPPANVVNTDVGCADATFTWNDVPCGDRHGAIIAYNYLVNDDGSGTEITMGDIADPAITTVNVDSLTPGNTYTFSIRAATSIGYGPLDNTTFTTTTVPAPNGVTNLSVVPDPSDSTKLLVTWTSPSHPLPTCSIPVSFVVEFELTNSDQCEVIAAPVPMTFTTTTDVSVVITGQEPHSTYTVYVTSTVGSVVGPTVSDSATTIEANESPCLKLIHNDSFVIVRELLLPETVYFPTTPVGVILADLRCTSAIFNWDPIPCGDRHGEISSYNYALYDNDGALVNSGDIGVADPLTIEIADLMHGGTIYQFSVAATTGAGQGQFSNALSLTTPLVPVPNGVTNLSVMPDPSDSTKLLVTWTSPSHPLPTCSIPVSFVVEFELTNSDQCEVIAAPVLMTFTTTTDVTVRITGLEPFSTYTVYVTSTVGSVGGPTVYVSATTIEAIPTTPVGVILADLRCTSAIFNWDPIPCGDRRGEISYNYALYDNDGALVNSGNIGVADPLTIEIADLMHGGTRYQFSVAATTGAGQGQFSNALSLTTPLVPPPQGVSNLSVMPESSDATKLRVTWTSPAHPLPTCPMALFFVIRFELTNRGQCEVISSPVQMTFTTTTDVSVVITGLESYSTYTVYVTSAIGSIGGHAVFVSATTIEAIPTAPVGVTVSAVWCTSAVLSWNPIPCGDRHGEIGSYSYALYDELGNTAKSGDVVGASYVDIVDLMPGTIYEFKVAAITGVGMGLFSDVLSLTTPVLSAIGDLAVVADEATFSLLHVSWTYPTSTQCAVEFIVEYELVRREECDIIYSTPKELYAIVSSLSVDIESLQALSIYRVFVTPTIDTRIGPVQSESATTGEGPPASVKDLRASLDGDSAHISWTFETTQANPCRATEFVVDYQVLNAFQCSSNNGPVPERVEYTRTSDMSAVIGGILPNTMYHIWVIAENSAGRSQEIKIDVRSHGTAPATAPPIVMYHETTGDQVPFTWNEIACEHMRGTFVSYEYELSSNSEDGSTTIGYVTETSVTLTLDPSMTYSFRVAVVNEFGVGPFSDPIRGPNDQECKL
ncbi:receptor-type tyrosine-protein phosphatase F-like [Amphiura filiformis]|uniref:receptor-type tyrosine-protein phosphatase F-like n=1 Tax=Amphiura filiformis TaxID=82378 RepID=UPI003B21F5CA